jgi:hypothetical protein
MGDIGIACLKPLKWHWHLHYQAPWHFGKLRTLLQAGADQVPGYWSLLLLSNKEY